MGECREVLGGGPAPPSKQVFFFFFWFMTQPPDLIQLASKWINKGK
jgi:hypothetical protein